MTVPDVPFTAEDRAAADHVDARLGFRLNCHTRDSDVRDAALMRTMSEARWRSPTVTPRTLVEVYGPVPY